MPKIATSWILNLLSGTDLLAIYFHPFFLTYIPHGTVAQECCSWHLCFKKGQFKDKNTYISKIYFFCEICFFFVVFCWNKTLLSSNPPTHICIRMGEELLFKGTAPRDFRVLVFFIKQLGQYHEIFESQFFSSDYFSWSETPGKVPYQCLGHRRILPYRCPGHRREVVFGVRDTTENYPTSVSDTGENYPTGVSDTAETYFLVLKKVCGVRDTT